MLQITEVDNNYKQSFQIQTEDNKNFNFELEFIENQASWFYSLKYNDVSINKKRITTHPNFLRQFQNLLPFGMSCMTEDGSEAFAIDDFSKQRAKLYVLTQDEVNNLESAIYG